jgi:hypothetical protein
MNGYWMIAGCMFAAGGLLHLVAGEVFIIGPIPAEQLRPAPFADRDAAKRYLRWFWHVGTVDILLGGALFLGLGARWVPASSMTARWIALHFFGYVLAYLVAIGRRPSLLVRIPQGPFMLLGAVLGWLGAS